MGPEAPFKICTSCGHRWSRRAQFLADPAVTLVGYQSFIQDEVLGLFLFNHDCGTTLTVRAVRFEDLHDGPIYELRSHAAARGPGLCLASEVDHGCPSACECRFVDQVTETVGRKAVDRDGEV